MLQRKDWAHGKGKQTSKSPKLNQFARLGGVQKVKEWVVRKGPRPTRGLKAKKKVLVHRMRAGVELGLGQDCGGRSGPVRKRPIIYLAHSSGLSMGLHGS